MKGPVERWELALVFILLLVTCATLVEAVHRQRMRVDELWKEYDTHARYCPCLHREWPVVEDHGK